MTTKIVVLSTLFLTLFLLLGGVLYHRNTTKTSAAAPKEIKTEGKVKVKYPVDVNIVLLGDSMTAALGNSEYLRADLKNYFPNKTFEVLNYGFGSTNILSVQKRLTEKTYEDREYRPITDIDFDIILFESFGHNPLSEYPEEEGLKKQTEALENAVQTIKTENPRAKIIFLTPIAPSRKNYALNQVDLTDSQRNQWVDERIAYIQNHVLFAKSHNIPVIDVFSASLAKDGDVNMDLVSDHDYIHPSPTGVVFISKQIADFLYQNHLIP